LETTLLLLEGLDGHEDKVSFAITGHSGDSPAIPLVEWDKPPQNETQRFRVMQLMAAHAQHCWSGDHTLMAFRQAVDRLHADESEGEGDKIVILLSDANLDRYGISPSQVKNIIRKHDDVKSHVFFIGSLYNQAESLVNALPSGSASVCEDTSQLPALLRKVVEASLE
jgi:von Willebrand factor A domain-containing protein 8